MLPYPLIFQPIFKPRIWGGRKLETKLHKELPAGAIGESWEIADLEDDQSIVSNGPHRGKTISQMMKLWGVDLLGSAKLLIDGRFPLLLKFLDAAQALSVQVHPSRAASANDPTLRYKDECWYVVEAQPGAWILRGVKPGVDVHEVRDALERRDVESVLNRIAIRSGHAYYIPTGTIHALGPGAVIAEIQTPSDTTYRLHDWERIDPKTGTFRELHLDAGLESIVLDPVPPESEHPEHVASVWTAITRLIQCESFVVERVRMVAGVEQPIPYDEMVAWMVLEGRAEIRCDGLGDALAFGVGDTVLLPAALKNGRVSIHEATVWLEITVPVPSSLGDLTRTQRSTLRTDPRTTFVPLNVQKKTDG